MIFDKRSCIYYILLVFHDGGGVFSPRTVLANERLSAHQITRTNRSGTGGEWIVAAGGQLNEYSIIREVGRTEGRSRASQITFT